MRFRHNQDEGGERGPRGFRMGFGPRGFGRHGPRGFTMSFGMERGEGRGRRRMFDGGELRLVLLKLIADQPRHGYDLIRAIEERTGGVYAPSPGVVYPTLTLLADMGHIEEQQSEGARKAFAATPEGAAHLEEKAAEVAAIFERLDALGAEAKRTDSMPIRRAMHNLRSILQNRLSGDADKDTVHAIVALLDEAAGKIERL